MIVNSVYFYVQMFALKILQLYLKVQLPFSPIDLDFFSFARGYWLKNLEVYKAIFFYCSSDRRSFSAALSLRKSGIDCSFALI